MNLRSIFHNKKSATGCCVVGPTDDWKNAESAPKLSRVLRRIYLLPSWKYLTSLISNIILNLLVRIHVQQIYLAATVCLWGLNHRESASSAAKLNLVLCWIHLLPSGIYFISLIVDILKMLMWMNIWATNIFLQQFASRGRAAGKVPRQQQGPLLWHTVSLNAQKYTLGGGVVMG